jgi:hypothetical protein
MDAILHVFTFKAGLLARMAHDLRLTFKQHEITVHARRVRAFAVAESLEIDGVMTASGLDTRTLSARDRRSILETVHNEILLSRSYPRIELDGSIQTLAGGRNMLSAELRLRGQARPIETELIRSGDHLQSVFELKPSAFGIAPYKALAGAIKLDDRVRISVDVALAGQTPEELLERSEPLQLKAATF